MTRDKAIETFQICLCVNLLVDLLALVVKRVVDPGE